MTQEKKKKFKQTLLKMLGKFAPVPEKNTVKIKFHSINDDITGERVQDRYVVVIKVKKGPIDVLFADQEGKSYYRLDGQTRKYLPQEYSDELIMRATKKQSLQEYAEKFCNDSKNAQKDNLSASESEKKSDSIVNDVNNYSIAEEDDPTSPLEEAKLYDEYKEFEDFAMHAYYQALEGQSALEECLRNQEAWYQNAPSADFENVIQNGAMGFLMNFPLNLGNFVAFTGEMPFSMQNAFYPPQQMMSQQGMSQQGMSQEDYPYFGHPQAQYVYHQHSESTMPNAQNQNPATNLINNPFLADALNDNSASSFNQFQTNQNQNQNQNTGF